MTSGPAWTAPIGGRLEALIARLRRRALDEDLPTPVYTAVGAADLIVRELDTAPHRARSMRTTVRARTGSLRSDLLNRVELAHGDAGTAVKESREELARSARRARSEVVALPRQAQARGERHRDQVGNWLATGSERARGLVGGVAVEVGEVVDTLTRRGERVLAEEYAERVFRSRVDRMTDRVTPSVARASVAARRATANLRPASSAEIAAAPPA